MSLSVVNVATGGTVLINQLARATCSVQEDNPQPATISWWIDGAERTDITGTTYDLTPTDFTSIMIECRASNGFVATRDGYE